MKYWLLLSLLFAMASAQAGDIQVVNISQQWGTSILSIKPQFQINTSEVIDEAINSGIELTLIAKLYGQKKRTFWFDETVSQQQIGFQIRYFSLSGQYQLHNTTTDERHSFVSLLDLWRHLEHNTQFSLPKKEAEMANYLSLRLRLDAGALPSAMQLPVLLSSDWRFKSDWYHSDILKAKQQP